MPSYTHTTFGSTKSLLAARLGDPSKTHWIDNELAYYLFDAIRTLNSLTGIHRDDVQFLTSAGAVFCDLPTLAPTQRAYTLTDQDIIRLIQYRFMEPISLTSWSPQGSEMWTFNEIVRAIERRRDQFIIDTANVLTQHSIPTDLDPVIDLPQDVTAIRRAVWRSSGGTYYQLWPSDEIVFTGARPSWLQSPGIPSSYSIAAVPNLRLVLFPPPIETGTLELLTLEPGTPLDPTANGNIGTKLGIPDDLAWAVRFGAEADLLRKDGPARDPERASLCEQMWELGVEVGRALPVVLTVAIDGVQLAPTTLNMLDSTSSGWQSKPRDTPSSVAVAGGDLMVLAPVPDGVHSVDVQLVRNAILPASPTDDTALIQVPKEDLESVLAWAEMLATFKSQGVQLQSAITGARKLLDRAAAYNERRSLGSTYLYELLGRSSDEHRERPVYRSTGSAGPGGQAAQLQPQQQRRSSDNASTRQSRSRSIAARRKRLGGR